MIVRMWHGRVRLSKGAGFAQFTDNRAIPDYRSVEENLSVHILQQRKGCITHFLTLTCWKNLELIKGVAGESMEATGNYPEDKDYLLEFEPEFQSYEVLRQEP